MWKTPDIINITLGNDRHNDEYWYSTIVFVISDSEPNYSIVVTPREGGCGM